jgi:hypothetical protein
MRKVLTFGEPRDQTTAVMAGSLQFAFPFTVVDEDLIGKPEERSVTRQHCVVVRICDVRVITWSLPQPDMVKVLFEIGSRYVAEKVKTNSLPDQTEIVMPMIGLSYPEKCPFGPAAIQRPTGAVVIVEVERRKMGFSP